MGKDKSGQRTKGNLKPSSSGRSAELLGGVNEFVGFGGLGDLGYVPAATQFSVDDDNQISAEFRVTLRKMSKKDSVTKIKALQEFEGLCSSENIECIKMAVPYWPRLFSKLCLDCDRRVREAVQVAHASLVHVLRKHLAPYLRLVMPSWLIAMADPHTPVRISATKSFQVAFSEEKRSGVMAFCCKDVMDCISDYLFVQTAKTLVDAKYTNPEDQESKYVRVIFCSLKGLAVYLSYTTKPTDRATIANRVVSLLNEEKFWRYAQNKNSIIRVAWYECIASLFDFNVELLRPHVVKLSEIVFSSLNEENIGILANIWVVFLHICVSLKECWDPCQNPMSVFDQIFAVLSDGCRGCALKLSPLLLPIMSVAPNSVREGNTEFYMNFFKSISAGLHDSRLIVSRSELDAMIVAYFECLKYMTTLRNDFEIDSKDKEIWCSLLGTQVIQHLESSLMDVSQLSESKLFNEVAQFLCHCSFKNEGKHYLKIFWQSFIGACSRIIYSGDANSINKLKKLMEILKNPPMKRKMVDKSVKQKIKFSSAELSVAEACSSISRELESIEINEDGLLLYMDAANEHIVEVTSLSYGKFISSNESHLYDLFAYLLSGFPSDIIYEKMNSEFLKIKGQKVEEKKMFLEELVLPLLEDGKDVPVLASLDIFMHIYAQLSFDYQRDLLENLKPTLRIDAFRLLTEKMAEKGEVNSVGINWLNSKSFIQRARKVMEDLCCSDRLEGKKLSESLLFVKFILRSGGQERNEFLNNLVSDMLNILKKYLTINDPRRTGAIAKGTSSSQPVIISIHVLLLLSDILEDLLQCQLGMNEDHLKFAFSTLFKYLCSMNPENEIDMRDKIFCSTISALKIYIDRINKDDMNNLLKKGTFLSCLLSEIKVKILEEDTTYFHIQYLIKIANDMLFIIHSHLEGIDEDGIILDHLVIQNILEGLLPNERELNQMEDDLSPIYISPAIIKGMFYCHQCPLPKKIIDQKCEWNQSYVKFCCFLVELLLSLCKRSKPDDSDSCTDIPHDSINFGGFTRWAVVVLHANCYASFMMKMLKRLKRNLIETDVEEGIMKLDEKMNMLLRVMNSGNRNLVIKIIKDRCMYGALSWCLTLHDVLSRWPSLFSLDYKKLTSEIDQSAIGATATMQILLKYQTNDYLLDYLNEEVSKMASLADDPFSALPCICTICSTLENVPNDDIENIINTIFDCLIKWRESANNIFLFASELCEISWEDISLSVSIIRLLTVIISNHSGRLLHAHWDLILCSLAAWNESLGETTNKFTSDKITVLAMFAASIGRCIGAVGEVMAKLREESSDKSNYPPSLLEEWDEFFSPPICARFLSLLVTCSETYSSVDRSIVLYLECIEVTKSVINMNASELKDIELPILFTTNDEDRKFELSDNTTFFMNHLTKMVFSPHPALQGVALMLLSTGLPNIMSEWEEGVCQTEQDEEQLQMALPYQFMALIEQSTPVVSDTLKESEFGSTVTIIPESDSHTLVCGYLLSWILTLHSLTHGKECNQQLYCTYIRDSGFLEKLLNVLFKLMPTIFKNKTDIFVRKIHYNPSDSIDPGLVERLACHVYIQCLSQLPAAVRAWYTNLDRHSQQIVDKFTTTFVSPILIANEINTINESTRKFDNMVVKSRPGAREIVATYTIDEASMELVLRLAPNHPLCTVTLEDHKRVGVSIGQWRNWLFGLNTMLSHRNTPLLNSLEFWKKNVDQKFEGIEECYICYYVLHGSNHQIPKLLCRTCKKKFHPVCLYKWFNTSNNSTCPICRSLF